MKPSVLLCLLMTICSPVPALDLDGNKLIMSPADMQHCAKGCRLFSAAEIAELDAVIRRLIEEAKKAPSKSCGRGDFV